MKNKIIITILSILVVGLVGYIAYDKIFSKNEVENNKGQQNETNENQNKHVELDENLKKELLETFEFVYDYYDYANAYCGELESDRNDAIQKDKLYYYKSTHFKSYNDMINYLKQYMKEDVIYGKASMGRDTKSYIEQNGKLYCADFNKGGNVYSLTNKTIKYSYPYNTLIYTTIEIELTLDEYKQIETYDVQFEKVNNKWIISSYKKTYSTLDY